jgi:hypothetical protein
MAQRLPHGADPPAGQVNSVTSPQAECVDN